MQKSYFSRYAWNQLDELSLEKSLTKICGEARFLSVQVFGRIYEQIINLHDYKSSREQLYGGEMANMSDEKSPTPLHSLQAGVFR